MTAAERMAWERLVTQASADRSSIAAHVQEHQRQLNAIQAASKRSSQRQAWLASWQDKLADVDAILAANEELLRLRGGPEDSIASTASLVQAATLELLRLRGREN